jgi:hypothetical protein
MNARGGSGGALRRRAGLPLFARAAAGARGGGGGGGGRRDDCRDDLFSLKAFFLKKISTLFLIADFFLQKKVFLRFNLRFFQCCRFQS